MIRFYSRTYTTSLPHFTSHTKLLLLSVFSAVSSHADWTWLGSLGLTAPDCRSQKSHCDWLSKSWYRAPSGAHDQIFISVWQLRSCFRGAPSLTRGRVCLLYVPLALASAVFLGSEPLGPRNHILLSQIWDFPFRRLLRLAWSRWRYSTPPQHGLLLTVEIYPLK
jgi:hypothetical protein